MPTMLASLRDKVLPLADDTVVLPGHGPATTIGRERATNPYLREVDWPRAARPAGLVNQESMSKPTPISGFPEWLPPQRMIEQHVLDRIRTTFELYGFAPLETRAVEPLDQLLRKGETSKEVYVLRRLQADADAGGGRRARPALRPDRAVRPVRAGERRQAAVPVPPLPDPEGVAGRAPAGGPLPRVPPGRHRRGRPGHAAVPLRGRDAAGDRRRAAGAADPAGAGSRSTTARSARASTAGSGSADPEAALRAVDKLDKIGPARVADAARRDRRRDRRAGQGVPARWPRSPPPDASFVDAVRALGVERPAARRGPGRAGPGGGDGRASTRPACCVADLKIARGLDYYTGTVYETQLRGYERFGSICSGGRYDNLASSGADRFPGRGHLDRRLPACSGCSSAPARCRSPGTVPTCVLVALPDEEQRRGVRPDRRRAARPRHRHRGVADARPSSASRSGTPSGAASRTSGSPGRRPDTVKDIRSGEQVDGGRGELGAAGGGPRARGHGRLAGWR